MGNFYGFERFPPTRRNKCTPENVLRAGNGMWQNTVKIPQQMFDEPTRIKFRKSHDHLADGHP